MGRDDSPSPSPARPGPACPVGSGAVRMGRWRYVTARERAGQKIRSDQIRVVVVDPPAR